MSKTLESDDASFFLATLGAMIFLPLLDLAAFGTLEPREQPGGYRCALMLCGVTWASSGLLLAARERCRVGAGRLPPILSLLRLLVLGLPAVGPASLPLWRTLAHRTAARSGSPVNGSADKQRFGSGEAGGAPASFWRWLADCSPTLPGVLWIIFAAPTAAGFLLQAAGSWPGGYRLVLVGTMVGVHTILTAAAVHFLLRWARGTSSLRSRLQPGLALLWLLPIPYLVFVGLVACAFVSGRRKQPSQGIALSGLDDWQSMLRKQEAQWYAGGTWARLRQPASEFRKLRCQPTSTRLVMLHHRVRCYLLLLETAAFMLGLSELARLLPALEVGAAAVPVGLTALGLLVGIVAAVLVLVRAIQRLVGIDGRLALLDRHPYHWFLAGGWLAVVVGLGLGSGLYLGDTPAVGKCLTLFGLVAAIVDTMPLFWQMLPSAPDDPHSGKLALTLWTLVDVGIMSTGLALVLQRPFATMPYFQLELLVAYSPLFGPLLGAAAMRRLLRPYTMQSLRRGSEERGRVLGMATTLLLPFGGLLIPWWIFLHHRCWPRQQLPERTVT